jgi:serine/threonine protein kinase
MFTVLQVGTPGYMAPQLLRKHVQYDGYKNDIWGLGCVLYEASALQAAFQAFNMAGLVKKVSSVCHTHA